MAQLITSSTIAGRPPPLDVVREWGEAIIKRRVRDSNKTGTSLADDDKLRKKWLKRFLKWQKHLNSACVRKIEAVRNEVCPEDLRKWFDELYEVINKFDILPENMYNMDETGFNNGDSEGRHVIVDSTISRRQQAQLGKQKWVTSVDSVCADGSSLPPLLIFRGATFVAEWVPSGFDQTWKFDHSQNG